MEENQKDRGRNNKRSQNKNKREGKKVFCPDMGVWKIINNCRSKWQSNHPEDEFIDLDKPYFKPTTLIKHRSLTYSNLSIAEAFNAEYDVVIDEQVATMAEFTPTELRVGQIIPLKIESVNKGGVVFNCSATKQVIETRNNFFHFEKMRDFTPNIPLPGRVVDVNKDRVMVDIFGLMVDQELTEVTSDPWKQNQIEIPEMDVVTVKNLHMVRGGFKGHVVLPGMSKFLGGDFELDAFIPGSQICLNITDDFEQYEGQTVKAFILSSSQGPDGKQSVVCSVKKYLQHLGNLTLMKWFNIWCNQDDETKKFGENVFHGKVTGVINSSKQCGAFIELPELNITGMIRKAADELVNYTMGMPLDVKFDTFDEGLEYDDSIGQFVHQVPFEVEAGALKKVNVKPIFKEA